MILSCPSKSRLLLAHEAAVSPLLFARASPVELDQFASSTKRRSGRSSPPSIHSLTLDHRPPAADVMMGLHGHNVWESGQLQGHLAHLEVYIPDSNFGFAIIFLFY